MTAALNQRADIPDWDDLFNRVVIFIKEANAEQIRYGPVLFADLCHQLTDELVRRSVPMLGLSVILTGIAKIQTPSGGDASTAVLTSIHSDLCKLCLAAKCFPPAYQFLQTDFADISKEAATSDPKYILLYFYYGGMILAAVKVRTCSLYSLDGTNIANSSLVFFRIFREPSTFSRSASRSRLPPSATSCSRRTRSTFSLPF